MAQRKPRFDPAGTLEDCFEPKSFQSAERISPEPVIVPEPAADALPAMSDGQIEKALELNETRRVRNATPVIAPTGKTLIYDFETWEFVGYLDGELIGRYRNSIEADQALDAVASARATREWMAAWNPDAAAQRAQVRAEIEAAMIEADGPELAFDEHAADLDAEAAFAAGFPLAEIEAAMIEAAACIECGGDATNGTECYEADEDGGPVLMGAMCDTCVQARYEAAKAAWVTVKKTNTDAQIAQAWAEAGPELVAESNAWAAMGMGDVAAEQRPEALRYLLRNEPTTTFLKLAALKIDEYAALVEVYANAFGYDVADVRYDWCFAPAMRDAIATLNAFAADWDAAVSRAREARELAMRLSRGITSEAFTPRRWKRALRRALRRAARRGPYQYETKWLNDGDDGPEPLGLPIPAPDPDVPGPKTGGAVAVAQATALFDDCAGQERRDPFPPHVRQMAADRPVIERRFGMDFLPDGSIWSEDGDRITLDVPPLKYLPSASRVLWDFSGTNQELRTVLSEVGVG